MENQVVCWVGVRPSGCLVEGLCIALLTRGLLWIHVPVCVFLVELSNLEGLKSIVSPGPLLLSEGSCAALQGAWNNPFC